MILDATTKSLELVLGAAHTSSALQWTISYANFTSATYGGGSSTGVSNGTTVVTILAAPAASNYRQVRNFTVCNTDTVAQTVTIQYNDNTNIRRITQRTLQPGEALEYTQDSGWHRQYEQNAISTVAGNLSVSGKFIVGDPGTEGSGITVGGVTYESTFKVSDIDGTNVAQSILHRHSTTLEPMLVGARSNSNTSAHAAVTNGMTLFSVYGVGTAGTDYKIFGSLQVGADSTGTISNTSAPGRWLFNVTPDGSVTPVTAVTIKNDKTVTFAGAISVPDDAYAVGWNGSVQAPTKNAVYDKIESLAGSGIANTPAGNIAATTVQAAINELDTEKVAKAGDTMTGNLLLQKSGNTDTSVTVQGTTSGASAQSRLYLITATANSFCGHALIDQSGLPYFNIFSGSAVSDIRIDFNNLYFRSQAGAQYGAFRSTGDFQMGGTNTVIDSNRLFNLRQYTVATLPAAGTAGRTAAVTDALAPTFLTAIAGGGAIKTPVYDNGTNWVAF